MAEQDVDYVAVLREVGFSPEWALRGAQVIERESRAGGYGGFRTAVNLLRIQGASTVWDEHQVEPVVRRVEAQEAAARISGHAGAAGLRVAARSAQEVDDRARVVAEETARTRALLEIARQMTPEEYDGRTLLRPHIEKALREQGVDTSHLRVGPPAPKDAAPVSSARPSWVGRAPAPKSVREHEAAAATPPPTSGSVTRNPDGSTTVVHEVSGGRLSNTYIPLEPAEAAEDLVESFKVLGLSEEAAKRAAAGR